MTSIACGGGPSLEQRREFSGLKDGSQVPGYCGYSPQLKYSVGKTYGNHTLELSQSYENRHPILNSITPQVKPGLRNVLPDSTGDNKYTKEMVPGYTGYIPRWPFKFGNTYKEDCDVCIDEHITNYKHHSSKMAGLARARTLPRGPLKAVSGDPAVRDRLNMYSDAPRPGQAILRENKRGSTEAPMPGYQGFVPRIHTTELGLGGRYHETTKNGLEAFAAEQEFHRKSQSAPITINRNPDSVKRMAASYNTRLYTNDGMIPKYTGYLPQRRYNFGNTYGDTTRALEVCAHDKPSFGQYMATRKSLPTALC